MKKYLWILLLLCGCTSERLLTKAQWLLEMPPPKTVEEGKAQAHLQSQIKLTEEKAKGAAKMETIKFVCVAGFIGSIFAIILGTGVIKNFGFGGLVACVAGIALAQLNISFPIWFAYGGAILALGIGGYAAWIAVRALKEIVKGNQTAKLNGAVKIIEDAQREEQSLATTKIVKSIIANLPKPDFE